MADLKGVLLRHYPELAATGLSNIKNAFEPWDEGRCLDREASPSRVRPGAAAGPLAWRQSASEEELRLAAGLREQGGEAPCGSAPRLLLGRPALRGRSGVLMGGCPRREGPPALIGPEGHASYPRERQPGGGR